MIEILRTASKYLVTKDEDGLKRSRLRVKPSVQALFGTHRKQPARHLFEKKKKREKEKKITKK